MDTKYVRKHTITFRHAETVWGIISASASARHCSRGRLALTATRTARQPLPLVSALRSATRCLSHLGFSRECQECLWPRGPILDWQRMDLRGFMWRPNVMPRVHWDAPSCPPSSSSQSSTVVQQCTFLGLERIRVHEVDTSSGFTTFRIGRGRLVWVCADT